MRTIVSQNKKSILNADLHEQFHCDIMSDNRHAVFSWHNSERTIVGSYSTEERAIKALGMLNKWLTCVLSAYGVEYWEGFNCSPKHSQL